MSVNGLYLAAVTGTITLIEVEPTTEDELLTSLTNNAREKTQDNVVLRHAFCVALCSAVKNLPTPERTSLGSYYAGSRDRIKSVYKIDTRVKGKFKATNPITQVERFNREMNYTVKINKPGGTFNYLTVVLTTTIVYCMDNVHLDPTFLGSFASYAPSAEILNKYCL